MTLNRDMIIWPSNSTHKYITPREAKAYIQTKICMWKFIAALSISQKAKATQMPINWWMDKYMWYIHNNEILQGNKKTEYWHELQHKWTLKTLWNEGSRTQKVTYCRTVFMWNVLLLVDQLRSRTLVLWLTMMFYLLARGMTTKLLITLRYHRIPQYPCHSK